MKQPITDTDRDDALPPGYDHNADHCIACGVCIPEGYSYCPACTARDWKDD